MSRLEQPAVPDEAHDEYIIDSDFHLHLPTEKLYPYIEDPLIRETLENRGPPPWKSTSIKAAYATQIRTGERWDRPHGVAINREEIREIMEELALDAVIVEPGTHLELAKSNYPTLTNALARAYNEYIVDRVIDVDAGIYSTLMVPHWDVDLALSELDRWGDERGFVAAQNWMTTETLWGDPGYDPILDEITALGLPLFLHIAPGAAQFGPNLVSESMRTNVERKVAEMGYALMANVMNMIMTGVFDKYPDLDVAMQEAGTNWIPYVAYRADDQYGAYGEDAKLSERLHERGQEYLERMPSEYLFDHFYTATQPIPLTSVKRADHVEALLTVCRAGETFMYSSDWPHLPMDPPNWIFELPGIDDDLRAKILHENTEDVIRTP